MSKTKVIMLAVAFTIGAMSPLTIGLSVQNKEARGADIPATASYKIRLISDLRLENLKERENAAEAICNDRSELIKGLIQLAEENIKPLPSSDPRFIEYPWHDAKHLSILLLGDLRATEAIPVLLENLEYKNPKTIVASELLDKGGWYPAVESLSKIGMPAVEPTINKLGGYSKDSLGRQLCCWILKEILGVRLARLRLEIAIEEIRDETVKQNLIAVLPYFKTPEEKAAEERARRQKASG